LVESVASGVGVGAGDVSAGGIAGEVVAGGVLSLATLGRAAGGSLTGAGVSVTRAAGEDGGAEGRVDGRDGLVFAGLLDALGALAVLRLTGVSSVAGVAALSAELATTTFSGGGDDSAWVGVLDATAATGLSLMAWSKATAPTSTPTTIVPKAIPK